MAQATRIRQEQRRWIRVLRRVAIRSDKEYRPVGERCREALSPANKPLQQTGLRPAAERRR